jgi:hypothetical protein
MLLRACAVCGAPGLQAPAGTLVTVDGALTRQYQARCPECGADRQFTFRLADDPVLEGDDEHPRFGGDRPSELIDPGEWLWFADRIAAGVPAAPDGLDPAERLAATVDLRTAAEAVGEALKFVSRELGAVPFSACRSDRGRSVYAQEPGQFGLTRLERARDTYRELAESFAA